MLHLPVLPPRTRPALVLRSTRRRRERIARLIRESQRRLGLVLQAVENQRSDCFAFILVVAHQHKRRVRMDCRDQQIMASEILTKAETYDSWYRKRFIPEALHWFPGTIVYLYFTVLAGFCYRHKSRPHTPGLQTQRNSLLRSSEALPYCRCSDTTCLPLLYCC